MTERTLARLSAAAIALFAIFMAAGYIVRPYVETMTGFEGLASAIIAEPLRWSWSYVMLYGALGFGALAALAMLFRVRETPAYRFAAVGVPAAIFGAAVLGAVFGALGLGAAAIAHSGGNLAAYFGTADVWAYPLYAIGGVAFFGGWLATLGGIVRHQVWPRTVAMGVFAAATVLAIAHILPWGWAAYVAAVAVVLAFFPVAYELWTEHGERRQHTAARPTSA